MRLSVLGVKDVGKAFSDAFAKGDLSARRGGYPSYAEVTMTFTSNFEQTYGEEWLLGFGLGNNDLVNVKASTAPAGENPTVKNSNRLGRGGSVGL